MGRKHIQHTVRYAELAPDRLKDFWRNLTWGTVRAVLGTLHRRCDSSVGTLGRTDIDSRTLKESDVAIGINARTAPRKCAERRRAARLGSVVHPCPAQSKSVWIAQLLAKWVGGE
jgi:hypothetical protein